MHVLVYYSIRLEYKNYAVYSHWVKKKKTKISISLVKDKAQNQKYLIIENIHWKASHYSTLSSGFRGSTINEGYRM